jgi:O-antigen ligase
LPLLALIALSLALGYAAFQKGGVWPADRHVCSLAIALISVFYWARVRRRAAAPPLARATRWLLAALLSVFAFQILPLPAGLVNALSPARAELQRAAAPVTGTANWITLSAVPVTSLALLLTLFACVLVLLLVREIAWRTGARPWLAAVPLIVIACLEAFLGLLQGGEGPAHGTYVNRNHFAGLLEMCLPFAVAYGFELLARTRGRDGPAVRPALAACGMFTCAALILAASVRSQSRMGFAAALFSLGLLGVVGAAFSRRRHWKLVPAAAALGAVLAGFLFLPTDALIARFAEIASAPGGSVGTRAEIWRETIPLLRDYPLVGCGLGSYESCFARYKTVVPMNTVEYAHNDYLQLLAEGGVVAFAVVIALVITVLAAAASRAARRPRTAPSYVALACLGALSAILLHSLVDFNLYIPANAVVAAWVAGLALAPPDSPWSANVSHNLT